MKHGAHIHFFHGAAGVGGRVTLLSRTAPAPPLVRIALDEPVHALARDLLILRDAGGHKTLAGGIVVDPFPPVRREPRQARALTLAALDSRMPSGP